ncbi:Rv3235 family protein, partial [Streptomyces sp. B1866]|uniref:Rv3235 family protein n=1 Tax=Streptomyces sp. B1866 TaxID=3075431 RepID=UPI00288E649D
RPRAAAPGAAARAAVTAGARTSPTGARTAGTGAQTARPSAAAAAAARLRERERMPHYWFAHRLLLALSGQRPVHTLLGHILSDAYDRLAALAPRTPLRPADGRREAPWVRDCGQYQPRAGVIEAFARIASGDRVRALAFRLERGADDRWRCAAFDIGSPPPF